AAGRIRDADHRHVRDLRMRAELVLDALRGEVLSLADDDVLPPPRDPEVALTVDHAEIARTQEAVGGEDVVQRWVEIADAELGAVGLDLALDVGAGDMTGAVDDARDAAGHRAPVGREA